ncbi:AraC family transcriptional regulator [Exiguobacterium alkaliphilum]|nr:AraC family transcriptional regulator [Exiguobacterium alkaliphilum]
MTFIEPSIQEMIDIVQRGIAGDGIHHMEVPSLYFIHQSVVSDPISRVNKPSYCLVLQGEKEVLLGDEKLIYQGGNSVVASVDLPVIGQVTEATAETPYIAIMVEFTLDDLVDAIGHPTDRFVDGEIERRGLFVGESDDALRDVTLRLTKLVEQPEHIATLAPLYKKELLYLLSQGPFGDVLTHLSSEGSRAFQIKGVIDYIMGNFTKVLRNEELAQVGNMSVSSLHRHFKEVTTLSPLQYQKQLRLQEARRLLLMQSADIGEAAFQVGYESPSQFSREYARLFGMSPRADIRHQRTGTSSE